MGGEHGEDDKEEGLEGRTKERKEDTQEKELKGEGIIGKAISKKVRKEGMKVKGIHVGEGPKRGGEHGEDERGEGDVQILLGNPTP